MPVRVWTWGWSSGSAVSSPHSCCVPLPHLLAQLAPGHPAQRFLATSTRCLWKTNHLKVGCLWAKPAPACCLLLRGNGGKVAVAERVRHSPAPRGTHTEHPTSWGWHLRSSRGCSAAGHSTGSAGSSGVGELLATPDLGTEVKAELFEPGSSLAGFWHSLQASTIRRRQCLVP